MQTLLFLSRWVGLPLVQSFNRFAVKMTLLAAGLAWLCASPALAQTEMPLYVFPSGANPVGALTQGWDGNFYGTTSAGGANGYGTVYRISTDGTFTNLYSFNGGTDGVGPNAALVQGSDGNFYGTTTGGGSNGYGTIFQITTNGAFTVLHMMRNTEGGNLTGGLVQASDHSFYGTAAYDGTNSDGTLFEVTTDGVLTVVHAFSGPDGEYPFGGLALGPDGNFYGTCESGGSSTNGTVFRITPGGVFTNLYSFSSASIGANPYSGLVLGMDGGFYGTTKHTVNGSGVGTVFRITTNGVFTALHFFGSGQDGGTPDYGNLVQTADGMLYGTTAAGGANNKGTVFQITTNGVETVLYSFTVSDGYNPDGGLTVGRDGKLYGTLYNGGTNGYGSVFVFTRFGSGIFSSIYSFGNGTSGNHPYGGLTTGPDGNLYGTTSAGGTGNGTIFRLSLTPSNSVFASLHVFNDTDGSIPDAPLVFDPNGVFYGTTQSGGVDIAGNVFGITTNGVFTNVYSFTGGNDGEGPYDGALVIGLNGALYGTTAQGGTDGSGNVFELTTNGLCTNIYSFTGGNDGYAPQGGLVQDTAGNLYGTALSAGSKGHGTIFEITNNGGFATLYSFGGTNGAGPEYGLIFGPDGALYGTTPSGGTNGNYGTAFRITTNGVFTSLHSFSNGNDGGAPNCTLFLGSDTNFYGTCETGGSGHGTVFRMSPGGVVTTLHAFDNTNGYTPVGQLALGGDGNLYGVTYTGGSSGDATEGTIFRVSFLFPPVIPAPGSLTVTLGPDAVTNQAQWMIDNNGTNLASGVTISNLSAGYHQICYLSVSNWTEPNCQVVLISPNALTGASGLYVTSLPPPPALMGATVSAKGVFQFSFTNSDSSASFSVWESTNPALPMVDWTDLGAASNLGGGMFQFTDTQATNSQGFYNVRSP
ncbi:MAG TPA: choice-of-anchor tandem repeat GloVer-containing protein [Verrucomicrobiae bacterium]|jgi:uncharacterized repeat protein (TIGR03803 family)